MALSVQRIRKELMQLQMNPPENLRAQIIDNNIYEWHFTIRGPENSEFEEGIYHGRIELPVEYPFKPPNIYFLTPSGRFDIKTKICLNITKFHPENWNPSWTIQVMLQGLTQHFIVSDTGVGSIQYSKDLIMKMAQESHNWNCEQCGPIIRILQPFQKKQQVHYNQIKKEIQEKEILENEDKNKFKEEKQKENEKQENKSEIPKQQEIPRQQEIPKQKEQKAKFKIEQEYLNSNQMKLFDGIIAQLYDEKRALKTFRQKQQEEEPIIKNEHPKQVVDQSKIVIINILIFSIIFALIFVNVGDILFEKAHIWLKG